MKRSDLSPDQKRVYGSICDWVRSGSGQPILSVGGYAGCGKTTLLAIFAAETNLRIAYVSFTGRASSILGRKLHAAGVQTTDRMQSDNERLLTGRWGHRFYAPGSAESHRPFCGTIHRLILRPLINFETEELYDWEERLTLDRRYDLIVVDEASMVGEKMLEKIRRHGIRILAVGDHGQLPPVMDKGTLMIDPDLRLEKIHRQAEGSPIIRLSRAIREEHKMDRSLADGKSLVFASANDLRRRILPEIAGTSPLGIAFLCWRNTTRVHINRTMREYLGYGGLLPQKGEPVVCLHNYPPIFNGMRGLMTENAVHLDDWWVLRARIEFPDEEIPATDYEVCRDQFHRRYPFDSIKDLKTSNIDVDNMSGAGKLFDFGYAMTIHKFQGSQVPHAIVQVDWKPDYSNEETRRRAYTAVTRASEKLTVLT